MTPTIFILLDMIFTIMNVLVITIPLHYFLSTTFSKAYLWASFLYISGLIIISLCLNNWDSKEGFVCSAALLFIELPIFGLAKLFKWKKGTTALIYLISISFLFLQKHLIINL